MSQPTASTSVKVCKHSSPYSSSLTTSAVGGGAASIFPAMKKAKSQAVASLIEGNKNEQQQVTPHVHFSESTMIENDPNDVVLEASAASELSFAALALEEDELPLILLGKRPRLRILQKSL